MPRLEAVRQQLGAVPNLFRLVAAAPAVLNGLVSLSGALGSVLDLTTREAIAIAVARVNGCDYCLSAHSYIGLNLAKAPASEVALFRQGQASATKLAAALRFATAIAKSVGAVSDAELTAVRDAGYTDGEILGITALVALNFFTNLLNNVAKTDVDFPLIRAAG